MKARLTTAVVLAAAAIAIGALASPAAAEKSVVSYIFGTASGGAYCNGITLTRVGKNAWGGQQTGCNTDGAGGFTATINKYKYIEATTTYLAEGLSNAYMIYLDKKNRAWYMYTYVSNGDGYVWTGVNNGVLLPADAPSKTRAEAPSNVHAKPGVRLDHMPAL